MSRPNRRSVLSGLVALSAASAPALALGASSASPDAALILMCEAHLGVIRAAEEASTYEDDCPLWQAYERSRDAIHAAVPVTMDGIIAKARAAKAEARDKNGAENPFTGPAAYWAWDLVNDLLRLEGRA